MTPAAITQLAAWSRDTSIAAGARAAPWVRCVRDTGPVDESVARELIKAHFAASAVGAPGGSPDDDIAAASEIYAEDAVLEWPQGRERVRGRANIVAFRSAYPTRMEFEVHRITGRDDLWVNEYTIRYDDRPVLAVGIM